MPLQGAPPGFDAHRAVEAVRKAMKVRPPIIAVPVAQKLTGGVTLPQGFGTDEKALTAAIAPLDAFQVEALRRTFETMTGKGLVKSVRAYVRLRGC